MKSTLIKSHDENGNIKMKAGVKISRIPKTQKQETKRKQVTIKKIIDDDSHIVQTVTLDAPEIGYIATKPFDEFKIGDFVPSDRVTIKLIKDKKVKKAELLIDNSSDVVSE